MSKNSFDRYGGIVSLIAFCILLVAVYKGNNKAPQIQQEVFPSFSQPSLIHTDRTFTEHDFLGKITLLHVWASWCQNCLSEQVQWEQIKATWPHQLLGLNYKDNMSNARRWLMEHGNLFEDHIYDPIGELGDKLGISGTPETFLIDENGEIIYHFKGILTPSTYQDIILNAIP